MPHESNVTLSWRSDLGIASPFQCLMGAMLVTSDNPHHAKARRRRDQWRRTFRQASRPQNADHTTDFYSLPEDCRATKVREDAKEKVTSKNAGHKPRHTRHPRTAISNIGEGESRPPPPRVSPRLDNAASIYTRRSRYLDCYISCHPLILLSSPSSRSF